MEVCSQNLNDPYTVLLKVNGNKCNMACMYCSELPKNFTENQCEFDVSKVSKILQRLPRNVEIIFHGGEPSLIGKENIYWLACYIRELGFETIPSIQTNGFLDDGWVDFFANNRNLLKVSISIDGNRECNKFRRTTNFNSEKAFETVDQFLHKLDKAQIEFRCIATINSSSWNYGDDVVSYFSQYEHLKFVRLNPCFDIDKDGMKEWAITPKQYLFCLKKAFNRMLELQTYKKFKIDPLMDMIGGMQEKVEEYEFKCNKFSSIFPDGSVMSCDAMREMEQKVDIDENMFTKFIQPEYVDSIIKKCNECKDLYICRGGCPPLMHRYEQYGRGMLEEYCQYRVGIRKYIQDMIK